MSKIIIILFLLPFGSCGQKPNMMIYDFGNCLALHITKDGVFTCNFKGTYYPEHIYDTTIKKWFVKLDGKDSVFYYRHDVVDVYIWNGRPKTELYGYVNNMGGGSITIGDKYTTDTLRIRRQVWGLPSKTNHEKK